MPAVQLPSTLSSTSKSGSVHAPVFVPKASTLTAIKSSNESAGRKIEALQDDSNVLRSRSPEFRADAPNFHPSQQKALVQPNMSYAYDRDQGSTLAPHPASVRALPSSGYNDAGGHQSASRAVPSPLPRLPAGFDSVATNNSYYANGARAAVLPFPRQSLDYHLYAPPLPHTSAHHPHQLAMRNFFVSYELREELQRKMEATWNGLSHSDGFQLANYFGLYPLDTPTERVTKDLNGPPNSGIGSFGFRSWVYRAGSERDGKCYILRRLEGFRLSNENALSVVERWRRLRHPNIVNVHEAFTTRQFGDHSLCFVYDYHPLANNIQEIYLTHSASQTAYSGRQRQPTDNVDERVFWSYVSQLTSAINAVHAAGLAVRTIEATKILVTGRHRLRISGCSIFDVVRYDEGSITNAQQEDFFDFGKVLLALLCGSSAAAQNLPRSLDHVARKYSADVTKIILFLLSKPSSTKRADDLVYLLGPRLLVDLNASEDYCDSLEAELMREVENGRLVRLLTKFGFVNERPEFDHDPKWSESGERYIIKLFRDYVFHQSDEGGRPVLDLSHILTCLNKLDAGIEERITLVSRDAQTCLVVSYREVQNALENAYRDLHGKGTGLLNFH